MVQKTTTILKTGVEKARMHPRNINQNNSCPCCSSSYWAAMPIFQTATNSHHTQDFKVIWNGSLATVYPPFGIRYGASLSNAPLKPGQIHGTYLGRNDLYAQKGTIAGTHLDEKSLATSLGGSMHEDLMLTKACCYYPHPAWSCTGYSGENFSIYTRIYTAVTAPCRTGSRWLETPTGLGCGSISNMAIHEAQYVRNQSQDDCCHSSCCNCSACGYSCVYLMAKPFEVSGGLYCAPFKTGRAYYEMHGLSGGIPSFAASILCHGIMDCFVLPLPVTICMSTLLTVQAVDECFPSGCGSYPVNIHPEGTWLHAEWNTARLRHETMRALQAPQPPVANRNDNKHAPLMTARLGRVDNTLASTATAAAPANVPVGTALPPIKRKPNKNRQSDVGTIQYLINPYNKNLVGKNAFGAAPRLNVLTPSEQHLASRLATDDLSLETAKRDLSKQTGFTAKLNRSGTTYNLNRRANFASTTAVSTTLTSPVMLRSDDDKDGNPASTTAAIVITTTTPAVGAAAASSPQQQILIKPATSATDPQGGSGTIPAATTTGRANQYQVPPTLSFFAAAQIRLQAASDLVPGIVDPNMSDDDDDAADIYQQRASSGNPTA